MSEIASCSKRYNVEYESSLAASEWCNITKIPWSTIGLARTEKYELEKQYPDKKFRIIEKTVLTKTVT